MRSDLLVLDLDGTILDKTLRLDPVLVTAVRGAIQRGLCVTLATGRMPSACRPYWVELGISVPVILYNGALIRDPANGEDLLRDALPAGLPWAAFPAFSNAPVDPLFFRDDALYCLERTFPVMAYCDEQRLVADEIADPERFLSAGEFVKCLFIGHPGVLSLVREELLPVVAPAARLVLSRPDYLELLPAAASKGRALEWLARRLEMPVLYHDERFSSVNAEQAMPAAGAERTRSPRGKRRLDAAAAAIILQSYIDADAAKANAR